MICRFSVRLVLSALAVVALALPSVGCKKKPTKVTSSSSRDASEPVVDEDYRFKLEWPGGDWKLAAEDEMRRLNPDAVAGAVSESHFAAVIVESAPGVEGPRFAQMLADNMTVQDKVVSAMKPMSFAGKDATAFEVRGQVNGMTLLFCVRTFTHQEFAYQVLGWTAKGDGAECSAFEPVFNAFSLLPGKVRSRALDTDVEDSTGVGWRLADGVFEDAVTGIRIEQPAGWRLQVGDELAQINPDADVGLAYGDPEVYLTLISEVSYEELDKLRAQMEANLAEIGVVATGATVAYSVAGEELTFRVFESDEGMPLEYLHAVRHRNGIATQVQAWYVAGNKKQAREVLPQALAAIGELSDKEVTALSETLADVRDGQNAVGRDWALRGGVFRDFEWGFQWKKPGPFWSIGVDQTDSRVQFEHRKLGLWGQISVEQTDDSLEDVHNAAAVAVFGGGEQKPVRIGKVRALRSDGVFNAGELELSYRIITAPLPGGKVLQMNLWGYARTMEHADDPAGAALAGLTLSVEPALSRAGARYVDRRLGFEFPDQPDWAFKEELPPQAQAVGTAPMWTGPRGKTAGVLALTVAGEAGTQDFLLDLLQQSMADRIGNQKEPTRTPATVAGVEARRLEWPRLLGGGLVLFLFQRDRTSYGIVLDQLDDEETTRFINGFRFID